MSLILGLFVWFLIFLKVKYNNKILLALILARLKKDDKHKTIEPQIKLKRLKQQQYFINKTEKE